MGPETVSQTPFLARNDVWTQKWGLGPQKIGSGAKNELLSLKYPLHVLLRAVGRMATTDARWVTIGGAWRATHGNGDDDIENEF